MHSIEKHHVFDGKILAASRRCIEDIRPETEDLSPTFEVLLVFWANILNAPILDGQVWVTTSRTR